MKTISTFFAVLALSSVVAFAQTEPPKPYGATPTERQLKWHDREFYGFVHFTTNTFTDKEWGFGDEKESIFNPTAFDADQIVAACKSAGMKGVILTCKHHDGYCLWPSKYTEHSVKNSPWKEGKGDVVKEFSDACRRQKMDFGVYLSPWDRNHKDYGRPAYVEYYRNQLRELLTNYGPICEVWFDGANGGDGYYGGERGVRNIDRKTYYDWENTYKIIRELQPDACMFSDVGPDTRWVGNESGYAGDPCWATLNDDGWCPGDADARQLNSGHRNGKKWIPAETDVSIRPGWFYHASQDKNVRTPENLMKLYFESVGRGSNLLLNIPPDRRGLVHENDVKSLAEFGRQWKEIFDVDLAKSAVVSASNIRGNDAGHFGPQNLLDGNRNTYWATDDAVVTPEVTLQFKEPVRFNIVRLREFLPLGQRIDDFALDAWIDGAWQEFYKGSAIGASRLVRTKPLVTTKVRLRITKSPVCPALAEFALFVEPERIETPKIVRNRQGEVILSAGSPVANIRYTLDGTEPTAKSSAYTNPFALPKGGIVRARTVSTKDGKMSETASATFGVSKAKWKVVSSSFSGPGGEAPRAIDENPGTLWHTHGNDGERNLPQEIVVDLGESMNVKGFTYLPRQDGTPHGMIDKYAFYLSEDGKTWSKPVAEGEFSNILANPILQTVSLAKPQKARYFKFVALHAVAKNHAALAELGIVGDF